MTSSGIPRSALTLPVAATVALLVTLPAAEPAAEPAGSTSDTGNGESTDVSWQEDVTSLDGNDVNVAVGPRGLHVRDSDKRFASGQGGRGARSFGSVTFERRTLDTAVNRFRVTREARVPRGASVTIDVRGRANSGWTEWHEAAAQQPARLPRRVSRVQVRVTLQVGSSDRSPVLRSVRLAGEVAPTARQAPRSTPRTYSVFATREGLVGNTTANGHVIRARDHFVALPSGRPLAPDGTGDYSVRVCSPDTGRCAFAPVWDRGPWNIRDDYWNPPSVREAWSDLPQGKPEAEAAYSDGYNGGRDGSGREVLNPAGIDLADGTFWDAVGLSGNAWVEVTYLWTGSYPATGEVVTSGSPLRVRSGPGTQERIVGLAGQHARVPIQCQARGETITGRLGTTNLWNKVGPQMYVSVAYTRTASKGRVAPRC